jgi:hypothetical protein
MPGCGSGSRSWPISGCGGWPGRRSRRITTTSLSSWRPGSRWPRSISGCGMSAGGQRGQLAAVCGGEPAEETCRSQVKVLRPWPAEPGAEAQIDYGRLGRWPDPVIGRMRTIWALVMVLACSRHLFVRPVIRLDQPQDMIGEVPAPRLPLRSGRSGQTPRARRTTADHRPSHRQSPCRRATAPPQPDNHAASANRQGRSRNLRPSSKHLVTGVVRLARWISTLTSVIGVS